ncbi:enoyl-CoA hydratase/isomerase family protein [Novosphingobium sp.]|uniref:enoyl-CoA hydratase/isomerase family protein n=1 Tax=Novosphingobium sp. TaxID=1874826 RepID=UPI0038BA950C
MTDGDFRLVQNGHIVTITLDRPAKRNALTSASLVQLKTMAESLSDNPEARVVIIRAEGRDFSVGADIGGMGGASEPPPTVQLRRTAEHGLRLMRALREIHQPTICAIQGIATGGATCIATACDFRIGTPDARIGYGEVKLGINLMWHALPLAIQAVGLARAKRMVMTGALFDAQTMLDWGFFDEIVAGDDRDDRDAAALRLAETYAALPPIAVQMIKRSANAYSGALDQAVMHADTDQWLLGTRTADFREGVSAFFERREARYTGD